MKANLVDPAKKMNSPKSSGASKLKNVFDGVQNYKDKKKYATRCLSCGSDNYFVANCPEKAAKTDKVQNRAAKRRRRHR